MDDEIDKILNRIKIREEIKDVLNQFDNNVNNIQFKKGIYLYGVSGSGISYFINSILKELNYDIIKYSTEHVRNKVFIQTINSQQISKYNIYELMHKKKKKLVILMDEIEGMNNGDKGGISALIKLIRQKKTKKQKLECFTLNPIICIGNCYIDKKIRELMKVCHVFEINKPTENQVLKIMDLWYPSSLLSSCKILKDKRLINYINGDFRKMIFIRELINKNKMNFIEYLIGPEFQNKFYNEDSKKITKSIFYGNYTIKEHEKFMNETDRTTVALLWHENICDILFNKNNLKKKELSIRKKNLLESKNKVITKTHPFTFYYKILQNICFSDFIDRITFQNQVWIFNEMSSLIKTFYNQFLLKKYCLEMDIKIDINEIRFTKVLTKYSTEYNNILFIHNLCQELKMDKKDVFSLFQELLYIYGDNFFNINHVFNLFDKTEITKLDLKRISRFLQKNLNNSNKNIINDNNDENNEDENDEDDIND